MGNYTFGGYTYSPYTYSSYTFNASTVSITVTVMVSYEEAFGACSAGYTSMFGVDGIVEEFGITVDGG